MLCQNVQRFVQIGWRNTITALAILFGFIFPILFTLCPFGQIETQRKQVKDRLPVQSWLFPGSLTLPRTKVSDAKLLRSERRMVRAVAEAGQASAASERTRRGESALHSGEFSRAKRVFVRKIFRNKFIQQA